MSDVNFCTDKSMFYVVPPDNALTIENCFVHFVFLFDAAIATSNQIVEQIGISDEFPLINSTPNYLRTFTVNQQADANRRVDISIDLSVLLSKNNVGYREDTLDVGDPTTGYTYIYFKLPEPLRNTTFVGNIELLKVDALFTTEGVR